MYDVIVIGGGIAGLSASLLLGRCNRKVLVIDNKNFRNIHADFAHGFLSRDHINPLELIKISKDQMSKYDITFNNDTVIDLKKDKKKFIITCSSGKSYTSRKCILATGLKDILPKIEGLEQFYGRTIEKCPYCKGFENNNKKIGVVGEDGVEFAIFLLNWSKNMILFTNGKKLSSFAKNKLNSFRIQYYEEKVVSFKGEGDKIMFVELENKNLVGVESIFLKLKKGQEQKSHLAEKIGLEVTKENGIKVSKNGKTKIEGLYAIGDATKDLLLIGIGVAEGIQAAIAINKEIVQENQNHETHNNPILYPNISIQERRFC